MCIMKIQKAWPDPRHYWCIFCLLFDSGVHESVHVEGYLACKKMHPPRTLPQAYGQGPRGFLGGWAFSYGRGTPVSSPGEPLVLPKFPVGNDHVKRLRHTLNS